MRESVKMCYKEHNQATPLVEVRAEVDVATDSPSVKKANISIGLVESTLLCIFTNS